MNTLHRKMIHEICEHFNCSYHEIFSKRRQKHLVYAKKTIYWILRKEGLTYNQIARLVDKDHETVIKGVRTLPEEFKSYAATIFNKYRKWGLREEKKQDDEVFSDRINRIAKMLNNGLSSEQIANLIGDSAEKVKDDISLYIGTKKVPDYRPNSKGFQLFYFFSQKNKKNY